MIPIKALIDRTMPGMTLDFETVRQTVCSGCGQPVTIRRTVMPIGPHRGKRISLAFGCQCAELAMVRELLRKREEKRKQRIHDLFDQNSLINQGLKQAAFDNFHPDNERLAQAKTICFQYAQTFSRQSGNLLLSGSYGVGKSHLAVSIIRQLMENGWTGLFISVPKLLTKLKATYSRHSEQTEDQLLSALEKVDCLVLDDIGAEYGNDHSGSWAAAKLFEVVDSRLGKPTIYTTNLNGHELQTKVGPRNFSRIMQDTKVVKMNCEDYRLSHFRE